MLETGELGLVMKHASLKHVLVHAGRLVHFDLESAHAPGVDPRDALADELSGLVRSLLRAPSRAEPERLGAALLAGHARAAISCARSWRAASAARCAGVCAVPPTAGADPASPSTTRCAG